ncbi:MAG TPA: hypothetical protein DCQ29_07130 [Chitinophagaceae bacterium]|nr:hypothetical protein [Chitinophagaceae bacterium]
MFGNSISAQIAKDTLKVGFYINHIFDIDYKKGTYKTSMFIWAVSKKKIYELNRYLDFIGQVNYEEYLNHEEMIIRPDSDTLYWSEIEVMVELLHEYDSKKFPFDTENIKMNIEFTDDDSDSTVFEIDNTSILNRVKIPNDWKLSSNPAIQNFITVYPTSFGDPRLRDYKVNTVGITFKLAREPLGLFFKIFIAMFISFLIACCSIFISNDSFEPKFALIVGGLFGTISNKYITDNILPESTSLNLSDQLHVVTVLFLLFLTIVTIYENRSKLADNKIYERWIFYSTLFLYSVVTLILVVTALP